MSVSLCVNGVFMDVYGRVHLCVRVPVYTRCMLGGKQLTNTGSQVAAAGAGLCGRSASEQRRLSVLPGWCCGSLRHQGRSSALLPTRALSLAVSRQAALSMTTGLSFRLDRSGLPVIPVSYASAR